MPSLSIFKRGRLPQNAVPDVPKPHFKISTHLDSVKIRISSCAKNFQS